MSLSLFLYLTAQVEPEIKHKPITPRDIRLKHVNIGYADKQI